MIDAIKARELMPSTQRRKYFCNEKLNEIFNQIKQAARNDKDNIIIFIYNYEYDIINFLEKNSFHVEEVAYSYEWLIDIDTYRCKYKISW